MMAPPSMSPPQADPPPPLASVAPGGSVVPAGGFAMNAQEPITTTVVAPAATPAPTSLGELGPRGTASSIAQPVVDPLTRHS